LEQDIVVNRTSTDCHPSADSVDNNSAHFVSQQENALSNSFVADVYVSAGALGYLGGNHFYDV
jgi:hypothetical protein